MRELAANELRRECDPSALGFQTTAELEPRKEANGSPAERIPPGQDRALAAVELGIEIDGDGYNIFAYGPAGTGKLEALRQFVETRAIERPVPEDCCYVNNFAEPHRPKLLRLPAGKGIALRRNMENLIGEVGTVLRAVFDGEEYQNRRRSITERVAKAQQELIETLAKEAAASGIALLRTPVGIAFAPLRGEEVLGPEEFGELPEEERSRLGTEMARFEAKIEEIMQKTPAAQREVRNRIQELNREVSRFAIGPLIDEIREKFAGLEPVQAYLEAVEADILDHAHSFLSRGDDEDATQMLQRLLGRDASQESFAGRFEVNIVVDHSQSEGAPVVYEDNPSVHNLLGRIEHVPRMGALVTDFTLIKSGALHRANGGYLLLDAARVLQQPFAWEALKRALESRRVTIESVGQMASVVSTYSLEPEPLPLSIKIILIGPPMLYYLLSTYDSDTPRLFKVQADFSPDMKREQGSDLAYAQLVAGLIGQHQLRPFDRSAVARIVEQGSRWAGDAGKLALHLERLEGLVRESDYWAGKNGHETVTDKDVQKALQAAELRADSLRERMLDETLRETILIDTEGSVVGQVNGLSVISLGDFRFGRPSRITARVRLGKGEVLDIEREVELSGPIHAKGVLILAGFLGSRYAADRPLSLSASLVFEQSYSGVDGDSASSAELYGLLSAIGEAPIRQSLAVTGSVNQRGQIQAIGGANEKIEGFFDLCSQRGLTGDQGVLIPEANVKHLGLADRVIEAVEAGKFHVYPVSTVDQGIELLTSMPAGEPDAEGRYPEESVNGRVHRRLAELSEIARRFSSPEPSGEGTTDTKTGDDA